LPFFEKIPEIAHPDGLYAVLSYIGFGISFAVIFAVEFVFTIGFTIYILLPFVVFKCSLYLLGTTFRRL
jgi:hypothetical protein